MQENFTKVFDILSETKGDILDIGYGWGVSSQHFYSKGVKSLTIIEKRKDDFIQLHESLLKQAGSIEERLGKLATEFNAAAEKLQTQNQPNLETQPVETSSKPESEPKPQPRRRGSMFGGELTLDD